MVSDTMTLATKRYGGYFAKDTMHCAERTAKDSMPITYPESEKDPVSAFLQSLFDGGNAHEALVFDQIVASSPEGAVALLVEQRDADGERTAQGKDQLETDTFNALLDPKVDVILGGRMGPVFEALLSEQRGDEVGEYDPSRISQPDIMLVGPREDFGMPAYLIPVDVKDHKALGGTRKARTWAMSELGDLATTFHVDREGSLNVDDFMQLAHYHRHMEHLGLDHINAQGAIVGREMKAVWGSLREQEFPAGDGSRTKKSALELYDQWEAIGHQVVSNATARDIDPGVAPLTFPELQPKCGECSWQTVCNDELTAYPGGGHITLLPGMTPVKAKGHYQAGVSSIRQLAMLDLGTAAAVEVDEAGLLDAPDAATANYKGGTKDLVKSVLQARSALSGKVVRAPGVDFVDLHRADVEVDFDLENSGGPVIAGADHPGGQLVYLWGTSETRTTRTRNGGMSSKVRVRLFSDFTDTAAGEVGAFVKFWSFLTGSRNAAHAAGKTWRAYHYTSHELGWIRKLADRYEGTPGVPTSFEVEELLNSGDIVDLYMIVSRELIWPTRAHGIKYLAKHAGFFWRASDAGGDQSMLWYTQACTARTAKDRAAFKRKVLDYNTDDIAAQRHLRDWISAQQSQDEPIRRLPDARSLPRPRPARAGL